MKIKLIKKEIPEGISELGGCSLQIVDKETVDLESSIEEAKDALCVVGDKLLIKGQFVGLFKSMIAGIERDGNARTIGDTITLYPVPTGEFDLDKGWDPAVNGVRIRARLLNEMDIDITKWEFEDVTPGRQPFTVESVQAGDVTGVVEALKTIAINGRNMPTSDVRVDYAMPEMGLVGSIPAAKLTPKATRLDIAADALAALNVPANDGKRLELTVRGNCANATIAGVFKYVVPTPTLATVQQETLEPNKVQIAPLKLTVGGTAIKLGTGDKLAFEATIDGATVENDITTDIKTNTDTELATDASGFNNHSTKPDSEWAGKDALLVLTKQGTRYTKAVHFIEE